MIQEMHRGMSDMIGGKSKNLENKMVELRQSMESILLSPTTSDDPSLRTLKCWLQQLQGLKNGNNASAQQDKFKFSLEDLLFLNTNGEIHELEMSLSRQRFKMPKRHKSNTWQQWQFKQVGKQKYRFKQSNMRFKQKESIDPVQEAFEQLRQKPDGQTEQEMIDLEKLRKSNKQEQNQIMFKESHCSAILKLIRDNANNVSDVQLGHSTFDDFREMVRIWKQFDLLIDGSSRKISFSSQGGMLQSTDDFQELSNQMVITMTTIGPAHKDIQSKQKNLEYVPSFLRLMVANLLATDTTEWIRLQKNKSSHTNSAQWIIVDQNLVKRSRGDRQLADGSVTIFEQLGDSYITVDISPLVDRIGQFGSFNQQWFTKRLHYTSDYTSNVNTRPLKLTDNDIQSYQQQNSNPRQNQMRWGQQMVHNMQEFMRLMRQNNSFITLKPNEPQGHPICALTSDFGCTDSKTVDLALVENMAAQAVSGPTYGEHLNIEPFASN